jgi:hypothetical protein
MKISVPLVAVWLAFAPASDAPPPKPVPVKCCGKCGGTGMVPTGDGITRVWCECPDTCPCAAKRPKPQRCENGVCR